MSQDIIRVELGTRSYDIVIGHDLLAEAGERIAAMAPKARVAIVTDETVAALHLEKARASLATAGLDCASIVVPAGEGSKNFATLQHVVEGVLASRLERGDLVLALGGGVVGDLAGFAAAITRRGMRFAQVPTTLLAQVDSSVGGKTGINTVQGKNLVGSFHQPILVLADLDVLDTLPRREFAAGYAEVAKYGLIDDPAFFGRLETEWQEVFGGGPARARAIAESCRSKARIVAADETETGERALLNLGHTFAHALEAACLFDPKRLVHGEAVSIGMVLAHRFSAALGLCPHEDAERVERHLSTVGLPVRIGEIPGGGMATEELMRHMAQDKKVARGQLTFILTRGVGRAFIARDVQSDQVRTFLDQEIGR